MKDLIIDTNIYNEKFILNAIEQYKVIVDVSFDLDIENNKATIKFICKEDMKQLFYDEFCNYLIALIAVES